MAEYFVSDTDGNDGNSGLVGFPWKTFQFALDNLGAGDILNVGGIHSNGGTPFTMNTGMVTPTSLARTTIRAYADSTALTHVTPDGRTVDAFELDGAGAANVFNTSGSKGHLLWQGMRFHNCTSYGLNPGAYNIFVDCEFWDACTAGYPMIRKTTSVYLQFRYCTFRDAPGSGIYGTYGEVIGCMFKDLGRSGIAGVTQATHIEGCYFVRCGGGSYMSIFPNNADGWKIVNNTFVDDGSAENYGVGLVSNSSFYNVVEGNLFVGFSHASAAAMEIGNGSYAGFLGANGFYDNTAKLSLLGGDYASIDESAGDVTEVADPFEDAAGGDYRIKTTSTLYGTFTPSQAGYNGGPGAATRNFGAWQDHVSPGGGGGGGGGGGAGAGNPNDPQAWSDGIPV